MNNPTINVYSPTINRREMDAVLTCLVDEKVGPGAALARLTAFLKEDFDCGAAVAFRTPQDALALIIDILGIEKSAPFMISALAPKWQLNALKELGQSFIILDVDEAKGTIDPMATQHGVNNGGRVLLTCGAFGVAPDMEKLSSLGVTVIEDITGCKGVSSTASFAIFTTEDKDCVTSGGGAVILSRAKQVATVLSNKAGSIERTKLLPDINSALLMVQLKEREKLAAFRQTLYTQFAQAVLPTKNKVLPHGEGDECQAFVLRLKSNIADAKLFAQNYGVEVLPAFEDTVIATLGKGEQEAFPRALELLKSAARFPLHSRLKKSDIEIILKVLRTLP